MTTHLFIRYYFWLLRDGGVSPPSRSFPPIPSSHQLVAGDVCVALIRHAERKQTTLRLLASEVTVLDRSVRLAGTTCAFVRFHLLLSGITNQDGRRTIHLGLTRLLQRTICSPRITFRKIRARTRCDEDCENSNPPHRSSNLRS